METYFEGFHDPFNKMAKGEAKLHYVGGPEVTPRQKQGNALKRGLVDMIFCPMGYFEGMVAEAGLMSVTNLHTKVLRENGAIDQLPGAVGRQDERENPELVLLRRGLPYLHHVHAETERPNGPRPLGPQDALHRDLQPVLQGHEARSPINMSAGEMYTGLQRGVVEGLAWPEGGLAKYGVQKFLKYRVYPGFYRSGSMVVVNLDKWKTLPKSVQDMLNKQGLAFEENSITILRKKANVDNEKLWASGLKKIELKGAVQSAYLRTIYERSWEARKDRKYTVPFAKLKEKMYSAP